MVEWKMAWVTHNSQWGRWPDTDVGYTDFPLPKSGTVSAQKELLGITFYPVYRDLWKLGIPRDQMNLYNGPLRDFRHTRNGMPPPGGYVDAIVANLAALASTHQILFWDHVTQCYPAVMSRLEAMFPVRILSYSDDSARSSPGQTFPVAKFFNVFVGAMEVYDSDTGAMVANTYQSWGLKDVRNVAMGCSVPIGIWLQGHPDFVPPPQEARTVDLVFVGGYYRHFSQLRRALLEELGQGALPFGFRMHGRMLGGGWLTDQQVLDLYLTAKFGLQLASSSLYSSRLWDYMALGVVPVMYDPWHELDRYAIHPGLNYLAFDGTKVGLIRCIAENKTRDFSSMVRRNRLLVQQVLAEYTLTPELFRICRDYLKAEA